MRLAGNEPDLDSEASSKRLVSYDEQEAFGENAEVTYWFSEENLLSEIMIFFNDGKEQCYADFQSMEATLRDMYGEPSEETYYYWEDKTNKVSQDKYDQALQEGNLSLFNTWYFGDAELTQLMYLSTSSNIVVHSVSITYKDK